MGHNDSTEFNEIVCVRPQNQCCFCLHLLHTDAWMEELSCRVTTNEINGFIRSIQMVNLTSLLVGLRASNKEDYNSFSSMESMT